MRMIDADALIERLNPYINKYGGESFPYDIVHDAFVYEIEHEPTIDAVPVVRCKDCKHFESNHIEKVSGIPLIVAHEICKRWGDGCKTSENGWCFMAERKEK